MHAAAQRSLSFACRIPASFALAQRYPPRILRYFHCTPAEPLALFPWSNNSSTSDSHAERNDQSATLAGTHSSADDPVSGETQDTPTDALVDSSLDTRERVAAHGAPARKLARNRRSEGLPPITIPAWFFARNVRLDLDDRSVPSRGILNIAPDAELSSDRREDVNEQRGSTAMEDMTHDSTHDTASTIDDFGLQDEPAYEVPVYRIKEAVFAEITALVSASLFTVRANSEGSLGIKSHIKLLCPFNGGVYFLDKIIEVVAAHLGTDVIKLDALDLAEIVGDYVREGTHTTSNAIWTLGYDAHNLLTRSHESDVDESEDESEEESAEEETKEDGRAAVSQFSVTAIPLATISKDMSSISDVVKKLRQHHSLIRSQMDKLRGGNRGNGNTPANFLQGQATSGQWNELKLTAMLETLLESSHSKRQEDEAEVEGNSSANTTGSGEQPVQTDLHGQGLEQIRQHSSVNSISSDLIHDHQPVATSAFPAKTIIHIRGYQEIRATRQGGQILEKLLEIVQKKRKEGLQITIVGTTASGDLIPEISRSGLEELQSEDAETAYRTVFITPDKAGPNGSLYDRDESRYISEINARHLLSMVRRLDPPAYHDVSGEILDTFASELKVGCEDRVSLSSYLENQVLSVDEVHRIVFTAIGKKGEKQQTVPNDLVSAMKIIEDSDDAKTEWVDDERTLRNPRKDVVRPKSSPSEAHLKRLRKTCNHHEKVLLRGVVNPESIHTTFKDVHAPAETIEALNTLTTLSLTRPDAFRYGVLATNRISGLLLYGPPGTGKTLLAKAVAKESGATMLEVSGSDVYDMYVGESEKNVRAIFSLAKKLAPCVVFIDEADAIFASRGSGTNRNSHRELINQFLREWDGMTETSAFIMVATNRPFDLDDAALRRLPRRLLVDLPSEKDRAAILRIHLKDEQLHPSVSVARLAADTPLYSGSDLKNIAVAAALACVREENEAKAKHGGDEPFAFPEKRMLEQRHFDRAMEEISASVNEDMSSLGAIRKFDEKYGDKRGKRKKLSYGFTPESGVREDAAKVRS